MFPKCTAIMAFRRCALKRLFYPAVGAQCADKNVVNFCFQALVRFPLHVQFENGTKASSCQENFSKLFRLYRA